LEVLLSTLIFGLSKSKHMINFKNKLGFLNYQGVLIEATGTGYKVFRKEYATFGEAVVAIQQARKALANSLNR